MVEISNSYPDIVYSDNKLAKLQVNGLSGEVAGKAMVIIYFNSVAVIENLQVLPSYRRNKIGTNLVTKIEEWSSEKKAKYTFMRFAPCDFGDAFTLSKLLLSNNYKFNGIGFIKKLDVSKTIPQ